MAVPKQQKTKSRRNNRRSHHALKKQGFSKCVKCGEIVLPHHLCENCGTYKDNQVVDVLAKLDKKDKKKKQAELVEQEKTAKPLTMEDLSKGQ